MDNDSWTWQPGEVDLNNRYFELKFGYDPQPMARIGIEENKNFTVEFLLYVCGDKEKQKEIFKEVIYEIELYLINNSEPDPVDYMIKHTQKCANTYSKVHWGYFPEGFKQIR